MTTAIVLLWMAAFPLMGSPGPATLSLAAIGAVYSGHGVVPGDLAVDALIKVLALVLVIMVVNTAWLVFGAAFSVVLRDPRRGRIANILFAILLVGSVVVGLL